MKAKLLFLLSSLMVCSMMFATVTYDFSAIDLTNLHVINGRINHTGGAQFSYYVYNNANDTVTLTVEGIPNIEFKNWDVNSHQAFIVSDYSHFICAQPNDSWSHLITIRNLNVNDIVTLHVINSYYFWPQNGKLYSGNNSRMASSGEVDVSFLAKDSILLIEARQYAINKITIEPGPSNDTIYLYSPFPEYNYAVRAWRDSYLELSPWMTPVPDHVGWYQTTILSSCTNLEFGWFDASKTEPIWENQSTQRKNCCSKTNTLSYDRLTPYYVPGVGWRNSFDSTGFSYSDTLYFYSPYPGYRYAVYCTTCGAWSRWMTPVPNHDGWYQTIVPAEPPSSLEIGWFIDDSLTRPNRKSVYYSSGEYINFDGVNKYYVEGCGWQNGFNQTCFDILDTVYLYVPHTNNKHRIWYSGTSIGGTPWMAPVSNHDSWYQSCVPFNGYNLIFCHYQASASNPLRQELMIGEDFADYDGCNAFYVNGRGWQYGFSDTIARQGGRCGDYLRWMLWDGVFSVSGKGEMFDYGDFSGPWYNFRNSIKSVLIGNEVTSIGKRAFVDCDSLTSVMISNSVNRIDTDAFAGCDTLQTITIPNSVTCIGYGAFSNCSRLKSIIVESGNSHYDSRNNCNAIIETSTNRLIQGCYTTIIPDNVSSIGDWAFSFCKKLTSIVIPNHVTRIGEYAFYDNIGLESVELGSSLMTIDDGAFIECGIKAFKCFSIIPPSVVGGENYDLPNTTIVYAPIESVDAYKRHEFWGRFTVIPFNTALEDVNEDYTLDELLSNPETKVYTLQGNDVTAQRNSLPAGVYVLHLGNKSGKVVIE